MITDPCMDVSIAPTSQSGVTDEYSGETKYFTLNPFDVEPALCASTVTYTCTAVNGPDAGDYSELCDDWIYPADANGNLGLTASASDKDTYPSGAY